MSDSWNYTIDDSFDFDLDVKYDFEAEVKLDLDTDITYESNVSIDTDIKVDTNITGNSATFNVDAQAIGDNGAVEVNLLAIATDSYSSITITGTVAVGGDCKGGCGGEEPPPPPPPPPPSFPQWPQDISNVVLYFAADGADDPDDLNDDGYVLVKIDNWPSAANDDLDNSLGDILDFLTDAGVISPNSVLLGAAIKGGNQPTAFYALDGDNDPDPLPPGAPQIETPPPQGQVPGSAIDFTFNYGAVFA